jgi:molybdopterin molybdotransferase
MKKGSHLSVDDAINAAVDAARSLANNRAPEPVSTALWDARGLVLAEDVLADRDQPAFDRSAMDGYAVRTADFAGDNATLRCVGEITAGSHFEGVIHPGETAAIMTGAPVPEGADAVVIMEKSRQDGDTIVLQDNPTLGQNIRRRGESCKAGDVAAERGRAIDALTVGVLASMGTTSVQTIRRPRVVIVGSGDELVDLEEEPQFGQIRDSNRHVLMSLVREGRGNVVDGGKVVDELQDLRRVIREAMNSDVLVLSGGVSIGSRDLVAEALVAEGVEILFHGVQMKPGKPVLVGRHASGLVFGLPGNPISTYVTAQLFLLPALRILSGHKLSGPWTIDAELDGTLKATGHRTTFHPGYLDQRPNGAWRCTPIAWHGSADQVQYAAGNCLIRREAGADTAKVGDTLRVVLPKPPI